MKIIKIRFNRIKRSKFLSGFTLIELLVVMAVILSIGGILTSIIFSTLRGTGKTTTLISVRSNGEYAISQIVKTIRNARSFNGVSSSSDFTSPSTSCVGTTVGAGTPTPAPTTYQSVEVTGFDNGITVLSCCMTTSNGDIPTIASTSAATAPIPPSSLCDNTSNSSLLNTGEIRLTSCSFTCSQASSNDYPTIGISFSLSQFASNSSINEQTVPPINFQTSVTMRNK